MLMRVAPLAVACLLGACATIGEDEIERGAVAPNAFEGLSLERPPGDAWKEWRGPARNGLAPRGLELPDGFPAVASGATWPELWRVEVGSGVAGVVADAGRVYCIARRDLEEIVSCHDAASGDVVWSRSNSIEPWGQPIPAWRITSGPLATPTLANGRLYTVGVHGLVQCFDAANGERIFAVSFVDLDGERSEYEYGHAASPLVHDGRLHVSFSTGPQEGEGAGHFLALDAETGELLWRALPETVAYPSAVVATIHGVEQIVVRTFERVVGLEPASGCILWQHAAEASGMTRDCVTPLVVDDVVFLSNDFHGTIAVKVIPGESGQLGARRLYRTGRLGSKSSSPLFREGYLYCLHRSGRFVCLDVATGERAWAVRAFGLQLSLIGFGERALALDDAGRFELLRLTPGRYESLGRWQIGEYTWAHPALDAERFYFRDGDDLVCLPLEGTNR